jgi:polysaccharide export outer membrane protein
MSKVSKVQKDYSLYIKKGKYNLLKRCKLSLPILLLYLMSSCYTAKDLNYIQSDSSYLEIPMHTTEYLVQVSDILDIKVQSRDPEQADFFNNTKIDNRNNQVNQASMFLSGYPVDNDGKINLAIVGELKVSGLTVKEIRNLIQIEIDKYLLNATVSVKITSFKISVLGDVKNPGTNFVYDTQSTLFEAISAAGDLNPTALRKVKLIRQVGDNTIVVKLDLTDPDIIRSPYYFMQPNDVIYVDTSEQNIKNTNSRNNLQIYAVILSAITTGILVINAVN